MIFVMVHGAYHGAWCWEKLIPHLEERGHSVVVAELPVDRPEAGALEYARAVESVMTGSDGPVLVAHSMGGLVAPVVASLRPVAMMVFISALLPIPGRSLAEQRAAEPVDAPLDFPPEFHQLENGVWRVGADTARRIFYHDLEKDLADWAIARLRPQGYRFMHEITPLQMWPQDVPVASIVCEDDRAVNPAWSADAARARLGVEPWMIGGGHSPFLGRPTELAELLDTLTGS